MNQVVATKIKHLEHWFNHFESILIAYSGGVDSALVMTIAHRQLHEKVLACIGVSPSYPHREKEQAITMAKELGIPYRLIETSEYSDPNYTANPSNRCYFCKTELFNQLQRVADKEGWQVIVDGTNADDTGDDRAGIKAAHEYGIRSPLLEVDISKEQVRAIAHQLKIPAWDKPAMACLSSRVPHGVPITPTLLRQIELAEDSLAEKGFKQFRVRHHGDLARIEVPQEDFQRAHDLRSDIVAGLRKVGYRHVCLDLAGFRSTPSTDLDVVSVTVKGKT